MDNLDLSVVIPALNERENLERLIPAIQEVARGLGIRAEIIVVDGPSRDGTSEAAAQLGAVVRRQSERGYGGALLEGFATAGAPYILTMDADLSHPAVFIRDLWASRDRAEMLIASRYVPGGGATVGGFRKILSIILNAVYRVVLSIPVRDLSSGFRLYRKDAVGRLALESRDFDVLEEILVLGYNRGWRIHEVPFRYMPRESGSSHVRLLHFGWAYLKTLLKMRRLRNRR
jgi:dolichol-phosphate mannosyltransferase